MQRQSKYDGYYETIKNFVLESKENLSNATFGNFHKKYPNINITDAFFYSARRKALGLQSYSEARKNRRQTKEIPAKTTSTKTRTTREKIYKQFFIIPKKDTTKEGLILLNKFIEKMNSSNYNTKFEIIEYTQTSNNESIIEVRESK